VDLPGEKLGPLLLGFPCLSQETISGCAEFLSRLAQPLLDRSVGALLAAPMP
jgi:hypothetical protein